MITVQIKNYWGGAAGSCECMLIIVNRVSARFTHLSTGRDSYSSLQEDRGVIL